ncbi:MAG: hypothetical protein NTZ95_04505, partial [Candidatus Omnitrophica bacterium]|nr:hypothetical protein [Candidatus Omnitrophota bacterium]
MSVIFTLDIGKRKRASSDLPRKDNGIFLKGNNGMCVILIHGLTGTPNEMKFIANFFNRKGYSVACPRLAYHGEPLWVLKKAKW